MWLDVKWNVTNVTLASTANPPQTPSLFSNPDNFNRLNASFYQMLLFVWSLCVTNTFTPIFNIYSSASLKQRNSLPLGSSKMQIFLLSIANCKIKPGISKEQNIQCTTTCSCGKPALNYLSFSVIYSKSFKLNRLHQNISSLIWICYFWLFFFFCTPLPFSWVFLQWKLLPSTTLSFS